MVGERGGGREWGRKKEGRDRGREDERTFLKNVSKKHLSPSFLPAT